MWKGDDQVVHTAISVDFYVYASHEISVWQPVWTALRRRGVDAQFVVEPPGINRARGSVPDAANGWKDDKSGEVIEDLMDAAMFERTTSILHRLGLPWLGESREDADVVMTTSGFGWIAHYGGQKVRTMYGVGAVTDSYGHGPINLGLDGILVHGPFSAEAISAHVPRERIHEVGFPKWAEAIRSGLDRDRCRQEMGIDPGRRPVVAWLPTWAHNSSLDVFASAVAGLAADHHVLAKPHHNNLRFERTRVEGIPAEIEVVEGLSSLVPLVVAADVVVGDVRSGGITEALLGDRPVVGLDSSGDFDDQHLLFGLERVVTLCTRPEDLRGAINHAMSNDSGRARERWARWFFGPDSGDDDERAADAVIAIARRGRERLRVRVGVDELDRRMRDLSEGISDFDTAQVIQLVWSVWPGDPRLVDLLTDLVTETDVSTLAACAREVRASGHVALCPLRSLALDGGAALDRRLGAAALGSVLFEDELCTEAFLAISATATEADLEPSLVMLLTHQPSVVPVFVTSAGSNSPNREVLIDLLTNAGADSDEVEALLPTG